MAERICTKFTGKLFGPLLRRVWVSGSKVKVTSDQKHT